MKKNSALLVLCSFLFVASCSSDENSSSPQTVIVDKNLNKQQTGSSANDLLSDRKFKSLVREVVYVNGFEPTAAAITNFINFLNARTFKSGGITVVKRGIPSPGTAPYSTEEIVAIEDANRTKYNSGDQIAVFAFFADGKSDKDLGNSFVLGTAYRNTSFVIYEQTLRGLSDSAFEPNRSVLETTVITHEFGHVLGLTNFGTAMQSNHEDTDNPKHCNNKSCLMYWTFDLSAAIGSMGTSGNVPQLDAQCIADLRGNGGR